MKKLFYEVGSLDKRCYEKFSLTEDLLMEHASLSIYSYIDKNVKRSKSILIVCGPGNNGADGIALARLLYLKYDVNLYIPFGVKSKMAILQLKRVKLLGINIIKEFSSSDVVIDCLFGSGLNKDLDKDSELIIDSMNSLNALKIACDIPSGINNKGQVTKKAFEAKITITMGALKVSLYTDIAKEYVGKIIVSNLGIQRDVYESNTNIYLLEKSDIKLPFRDKKNSHKGDFGHLNVIAGCKKGAGIIASKAAFSFGAGLVSIVCHEEIHLPSYIMQTHSISNNCSAIAIGMGLGNYENEEIKSILSKDIPLIIDADLFHEEIILDVLEKNVVLTPHPKEFCSLLKISGIDNIDIKTLQDNRFFYVEKFCKKYPNIVLLLKGANVLISKDNKIYVNCFGNSNLSKAGSGDVLSGLIGSLLSQGYDPLHATINSSLAHALASNNYKRNNYSLIPDDLIQEIEKL